MPNKSTQLNSLRSLPEFFGRDNNISVVVPKVQRAYAQGRANEENLRTQFVNRIFESLETDTPLELSFVYGSKTQEGEDSYRFELLDGQQRITTLLLLYWYIASAEGKEVPHFIKSFTYETRTTSANFLKELENSTISISDESPASTIRERQWYTTSFDKDESVTGMMNMLDAIHDRYIISDQKGQLFDRLDNLKFYELDLEDFGLSEEIYVKMNARGLQLTPFENFKADLIKFMKRDDMTQFQETVQMDISRKQTAPYFLNFSQKLDNRWLNMFWSKEDRTGRDYCIRYFRFFYHFFTAKLFLEIQNNKPALDYRPKSEDNKSWDFFWRLSPEQDKTYLGFKYYQEILLQHPEYIRIIEKILDWMSQPGIKDLLDEELREPWNTENKWVLFDKRYRLQDAVIFTAICEYVERSSENFDTLNFRRWIHIVRNIMADQLFRNVSEYVSVSRSLVYILDQPDATTNIYRALANMKLPENGLRAIREAIAKAKIIVSNPDQDWESVFTSAEKHPLFAGSIAFMLHNLPTTPEAFAHRAENIGRLFDTNGITEAGKKGHRLIRSFMRQLQSREALISSPATTITERRDKENHLRSLLIEKEEIGLFICKLGDLPTTDDIFSHIDSIVDSDPTIEEKSSLFPAQDKRLSRAYRRLCLDPAIYDFISDIEHAKDRAVIFMERNGNYTVDYKNSWYDRIYIGTDRVHAIRAALSLGYSFFSDGDQECMDLYNDVKDDITYHNDSAYNGIWLSKDFNEDHYLEIVICHDGTIYFCIDSQDEELSQLFPDKTPHGEDDFIIAETSVEDSSQLADFISELQRLETLINDNLRH